MKSELKMMAASDLVPWENNPRFNDHAVDMLAKSIEEFGFASPVVVRRADNMVICGNTRLKAAHKLNLKQIPVHLVDLDRRTAERLAIADNKVGGIATWDDIKLGDLLSDYTDAELDALGFADEELADLIEDSEEESSFEGNGSPPEKVKSDVTFQLMKGDCLELLKQLPDNSIDSIVTDPPYHLTSIVDRFGGENAAPAKEGTDGAFKRASRGFMNQKWDGGDIAFNPELWKECMRVLKHGGYIVAFSSTRTVFRMGVAMMNAGLIIRDTIHWLHKTGFPKGMNLSVAVDKHLGAEREVVSSKKQSGAKFKLTEKLIDNGGFNDPERESYDITAPATPEAKRAEGLNIALKPAVEPAILARKPLDGNNVENWLKHGTGALNIDACRYPYNVKDNGWIGSNAIDPDGHPLGRYPANVFVCAKPTRKERDAGLKHLKPKTGFDINGRNPENIGHKSPHAGTGRTSDNILNHHATVKPIKLMRWLIRLVTPEGGTVLDPFGGSGTTACAAVLEGRHSILCEITEEYHALIEGRVEHAKRTREKEKQQYKLF